MLTRGNGGHGGPMLMMTVQDRVFEHHRGPLKMQTTEASDAWTSSFPSRLDGDLVHTLDAQLEHGIRF
jgi:hypothetical protein